MKDKNGNSTVSYGNNSSKHCLRFRRKPAQRFREYPSFTYNTQTEQSYKAIGHIIRSEINGIL